MTRNESEISLGFTLAYSLAQFESLNFMTEVSSGIYV